MAGQIVRPWLTNGSSRLHAAAGSCLTKTPMGCKHFPLLVGRLPTVGLVGMQHSIRHAHHSSRIALVDGEGSHTYDALVRRSQSLASAVKDICDNSNGPRHVSLLCSSDASYVTALLATWASGAAAVPLCTAHPVAEMKYFVENSSSACVLASPEWESRARELGLPVLVVPPGGPGAVAEAAATAAAAAAALLPKHAGDAKMSQAALIIYTSGTTSKPKGVVLSFSNLRAQVDNMITAWKWSASDVILHTLPLHHVHGVINALLTPLNCGATIVMHPKFDAANVWSALLDKKSNVNIMMGVPTMYAKLLEDYEQRLSKQVTAKDIKDRCLQNIRLMVSGSSALTLPVMKKWHDVTGHWLLERYGMTEVGMALTNPLHGERRPGAVGQPFPSVKVRIVQPSTASTNGYEVLCEGSSRGTVVTPGHEGKPGELLIAGPSVFTSYWNKPKETADTFTPDGWFRTGDSASHTNGYYSILGRMSVDIIKSGGYKISALDIERVILGRDDIAECAVVGVPDPVWGQRVAAVLAMKAGCPPLTTAALREWGRSRLPSYQLPSAVVCMPELPRNALGKINKKDLVKRLFPSDGEKTT